MTNELKINGKDAYTTWGVSMGEGFLENILLPAPLKEFIENESRLQHGKQVNYANPRKASRDVSLLFFIEGSSSTDYLTKYKAFSEELAKGEIKVNIPALGNEVYKLTYLRATSFALNVKRTFSKLDVKFTEPNPADRS